jgi:hypothetical protein
MYNPTLFHASLYNTATQHVLHGMLFPLLGFEVTSLRNRKEILMFDVPLTLVGQGFSIQDTVNTGVHRKDSASFNHTAKPLRLPDPHFLTYSCKSLLYDHKS